jgi:hypothetical protein
MDRARARRRDANTDLAGELRMPTRHERRHFLVARLYEADSMLRALQRSDDSGGAVSRISIDAPYAPMGETVDQ